LTDRKDGKEKINTLLRTGDNKCPICSRMLFEVTEEGIVKDCPRCKNITIVFHFAGWPNNDQTSCSENKILDKEIKI